jgi:hypothetical protein
MPSLSSIIILIILIITTLLLLTINNNIISIVTAHVEDLCVSPPGTTPTSGIYNFYTTASRLGCNYREIGNKCLASVLSESGNTFGDTSKCRGVVHFNAVYFNAVALGFTQEIAYFMAAFSQAIDFVQYEAIDACGKQMDKRFWTPPMRGLLRTATKFGGTNRHLGIPWIGYFKETPGGIPRLNSSSNRWEEWSLLSSPDTSSSTSGGYGFPMFQQRKTYTGGSIHGCNADHFKYSYSQYTSSNSNECPGLNPNSNDLFYDGALSVGRKWAFGQSELLCNGGFTIPNPITGSIFTGDECPKVGTQYTIDVGTIQQGPIPLAGGNLELGIQVIHYECNPNCTSNPTNIEPTSVVRAPQFAKYLSSQSKMNGYAKLANGESVPVDVAKMGIYLHWVADRASHWYCTDASGSGIASVLKKPAKPSKKHQRGKKNITPINNQYDVYMYLDPMACNFLEHGMVHYWEQGMNGEGLISSLAPGSYGALRMMFLETKAFRDEHIKQHPEWFRPNAIPLSFDLVIGTDSKPGILYNVTAIPEADVRFEEWMNQLAKYNLPPLPGFETTCRASVVKKQRFRHRVLGMDDGEL